MNDSFQGVALIWLGMILCHILIFREGLIVAMKDALLLLVTLAVTAYGIVLFRIGMDIWSV